MYVTPEMLYNYIAKSNSTVAYIYNIQAPLTSTDHAHINLVTYRQCSYSYGYSYTINNSVGEVGGTNKISTTLSTALGSYLTTTLDTEYGINSNTTLEPLVANTYGLPYGVIADIRTMRDITNASKDVLLAYRKQVEIAIAKLVTTRKAQKLWRTYADLMLANIPQELETIAVVDVFVARVNSIIDGLVQ